MTADRLPAQQVSAVGRREATRALIRRFIVVRETERQDKSAVGRRLMDVPGYTFRIWVSNRDEGPMTLWRDYNQCATIEQRIE